MHVAAPFAEGTNAANKIRTLGLARQTVRVTPHPRLCNIYRALKQDHLQVLDLSRCRHCSGTSCTLWAGDALLTLLQSQGTAMGSSAHPNNGYCFRFSKDASRSLCIGCTWGTVSFATTRIRNYTLFYFSHGRFDAIKRLQKWWVKALLHITYAFD